MHAALLTCRVLGRLASSCHGYLHVYILVLLLRCRAHCTCTRQFGEYTAYQLPSSWTCAQAAALLP